MLENALNLDLSELPQENMTFQDIIVNVDGSKPSLLMMIQDHSPEMISHVLRLYKLKEDREGFVIEEEIEAFPFPTHEDAVSFAKRLVDMTAIDMLKFFGKNPQSNAKHRHQ